MRRILLAVLCVLLAFYVGWPLWSLMSLRSALKAEDAATVERKIDFPSVRASLLPVVTERAGEMFDAQIKQLGGGAGLIAAQLKPQVLPKLINSSLDALVTAPNVIRIANDTGPMKERIERILREQLGKMPGIPGGGAGGAPAAVGGVQIPGGLGQIAGQLGIGKGKAAEPAPAPAATPAVPAAAAGSGKSDFGLSNIKRFALTGPLGFEVGVAKDAAAAAPDVTARMGFSGLDWKLTGLVPRL